MASNRAEAVQARSRAGLDSASARQRSKVASDTLSSFDKVEIGVFVGGNMRATARSLNACPYLAISFFQYRPRIRYFSEATTSLTQGDLQRLFADDDLRNLNFIGGTFFWSEPRKLEQGWGFADMSEVNLVVAADGKVEAYWAHPIKDIPGSTDCICALANSLEGYLEALFCAEFQRSVFIRGFPDEDPVRFKKTILVAKQCALIAGGYEYYDFWAGLLGLPDTDTIPES